MRTKEESIAIFREREAEWRQSPLTWVGFLFKSDNWKDFILEFINENGDTSLYKDKSDQYTIDDKLEDKCNHGKRRSLGDLYKITINYFPETDLVEFATYLTKLSEEKTISVHICGDISKMVFPSTKQYSKCLMSECYSYGYNYTYTGEAKPNNYGSLEAARVTIDNLYHEDYLNLIN